MHILNENPILLLALRFCILLFSPFALVIILNIALVFFFFLFPSIFLLISFRGLLLMFRILSEFAQKFIKEDEITMMEIDNCSSEFYHDDEWDWDIENREKMIITSESEIDNHRQILMMKKEEFQLDRNSDHSPDSVPRIPQTEPEPVLLTTISPFDLIYASLICF